MVKFFSKWLTRQARTGGCTVALAALAMVSWQSAHAAMSQVPLLTQTGSAEPNLMLLFDNSGSMKAQYLYQYGGTGGGMGMPGPGSGGKQANCPSTPSITATCTYDTSAAATAYYERSPSVNRLYYDPRIRYRPRVNSAGVEQVAGSIVGMGAFNVYFYKDSAGTAPMVWPGTGNDPTLLTSYLTSYTPPASVLATGATPGLSYPQTIINGGGPYPKFLNRIDCNAGVAGGDCKVKEEQQNYANWMKYYSNRLDLAKSGLGYAFKDIGATLRLGWGVFSELGYTGESEGHGGTAPTSLGSTYGQGVSLFNQTRKDAFYNWLYANISDQSTPSRGALVTVGDYYRRADEKGPWANTPDPLSKGIATLATTATDTTASRKLHASCRRSYAMMITDGYYNDQAESVNVGEVDATAKTLTGSTPAGATLTFVYKGTERPYAQSTASNTMADVAMKYWITDLRTDLTNNVRQVADTLVDGVITSKGNESFWQNMGFYGVSLGIPGTLTQDKATQDLLTTTNATHLDWPVPPASGNNATTIDDIWHATINARGRMLSAKNADELSDGVESLLADINKVTSSQSGVAASTLSLTTTTDKYTPQYTTGLWVGNVTKTKLDPLSGAETCTLWQVIGEVTLDSASPPPPCAVSPSTTAVTTTYSGIDSYTTRPIYAWTQPTTGTFVMGNFNASNAYVKSIVGNDTDLINYLRGDTTNEDSSTAAGKYRSRQSILGDIVNSTPTLIKGALDMKYDKLPAGTWGQADYKTFVTTKTSREGVLFAGANDGMLHGFRDGVDGVTSGNGRGGQEVFAFVPRAVLPNLSKLATRSYDHLYYVDGPTVEADACFGTSSVCTWKNLLLGTTGAGGKSVFAIDVTTPTSMTAASVKWEITPTVTGYERLGHILTDVQTGLSSSGQWVAVFGNGYFGGNLVSTTLTDLTKNPASLYVVDLDTGTLIKELVVPANIPAGTGTSSLVSTVPNGLGGVRLVRDANQRIIGAYAGDLKGNMWKFDLSGATTGSWVVAGPSGAPIPLFKTNAASAVPATVVKPITAAPTLIAHPSGGSIVTFGTGKFFEPTDLSDTTKQSLYGVWDKVAFGAASPTVVTQVDRTNLVLQTISSTATAGFYVRTNADLSTTSMALNYYAMSRNTIDWATKNGWYIDFPFTGQRVIYPPEALVGKFAAVDTMSPSNAVQADLCTKSGMGKAWNYVLDMVTGGAPAAAIFDTNASGSITTDDGLVSGYENMADGRTRYIKNEARSSSKSTYYTPLSTEQLPGFGISCTLTNTCLNGVKRTWRQLFLR